MEGLRGGQPCLGDKCLAEEAQWIPTPRKHARSLPPCMHHTAACTHAHLFVFVDGGCSLTPHCHHSCMPRGPEQDPLTIHCMHTSMYARFSTSKFTRVSSGGPTARRA